MENSYIVRNSRSDYAGVCQYLVKQLDMVDIARTARARSIKSKLSLIYDIVLNTFFLLGKLPTIRRANQIFCVGYIAIPLLVLTKLKIIHCRHLYWFAFFLHSPKWFPLFRLIFRLFWCKNNYLIVFSRHETDYYSEHLDIPRSQFIYVAYGTGPVNEPQIIEGDYCFAGGYSNRDYETLVDAFRQLPERLIICASSQNTLPKNLPPNIEIVYDLPLHQFLQLVAESKICIMPLYPNSGSSGQSVTLKYMQFGKPIIATHDPVVGDYLNPENAILIEPKNSQAIVDAMKQLSVDAGKRKTLGAKAREDYFANFQSFHFQAKILNALRRENGSM